MSQTNPKTYSDWAEIPRGLCLIKMLHRRTGSHCLHMHLKVDDSPWYEQPKIPAAYSHEATKDTHAAFWKWATETLPTWDYPEQV